MFFFRPSSYCQLLIRAFPRGEAPPSADIPCARPTAAFAPINRSRWMRTKRMREKEEEEEEVMMLREQEEDRLSCNDILRRSARVRARRRRREGKKRERKRIHLENACIRRNVRNACARCRLHGETPSDFTRGADHPSLSAPLSRRKGGHRVQRGKLVRHYMRAAPNYRRTPSVSLTFRPAS